MVNTDDYDNGAFFSGKITKSILRKRKVVKMKRKKVVKIKKNKMLVQRSKSKSIKHGKKLFGGSVTKVKQRQVRNIPSYSTRSLNNTNNRNNNYRATSKLSLSKVLSTARQLTPEQQARTANCINYVFNIIGGPRGPIGPAGKDGTPGGATAECNGYIIDQNLRTTDGVTFNTVEATTSYSLAGVTVTSTEWGYLANMDQDVNTTADVTFNSVTATTSYSLGSTTIDATTWNRLATIDQDLSTTDDVNFDSVTVADGERVNLRSNGSVYITSPSTTAIELGTNSGSPLTISESNIFPDLNNSRDLGSNGIRWRILYLGTSIDLGGTAIDSTQWNRLATIDQDLLTTSDVTFNTLSLGAGNTALQSLNISNGSSTGGFYMSADNTLQLIFNNNPSQYTLSLSNTGLYPTGTNVKFLGASGAEWDRFYVNEYIDLGGTQIGTTQWNYLASVTAPAFDQSLNTTDDVTFNSVTINGGENLTLFSNQVYINAPSTTAIDFYTNNIKRLTISDTGLIPANSSYDLGASTLRWRTLYLGTSIDLGGTVIGSTQWNYLAGVTAPFSDQSLNIADDVNFNSIQVPYNTTDETPTVQLGSASVGVYSTNSNDIRFTLGGNLKYIIDLTGFYPEDTDNNDLGSGARFWKDLYLQQKANVGQLNISNPTVPASAGAAGTAGDIAWDTNYIYVCVAASTWKRALLSTW